MDTPIGKNSIRRPEDILNWLSSKDLNKQLSRPVDIDKLAELINKRFEGIKSQNLDELAMLIGDQKRKLMGELMSQMDQKGLNRTKNKISKLFSRSSSQALPAYNAIDTLNELMKPCKSKHAKECLVILEKLKSQILADTVSKFSRFDKGEFTGQTSKDIQRQVTQHLDSKTLRSLSQTSKAMNTLANERLISERKTKAKRA
jgi:hypothetical protein